jgi:hypothetical protein
MAHKINDADRVIAEAERLRHEMLVMAGRLEVFSELLNDAVAERYGDENDEGGSREPGAPGPSTG